MIYKTDTILGVAFPTVKELAEYLNNHKGKEIGFTSDTAMDVLIEDTEPSGWYGVTFTSIFDSGVIAFGYYGTGIDAIYNPVLDEEIFDSITKGIVFAIIDYFKKTFDMDINEDYKVCVSAEDLED